MICAGQVAGQAKCIFFLLESELKHVGYCGALGNPVLAHLEHLLTIFGCITGHKRPLWIDEKYIFVTVTRCLRIDRNATVTITT
jgi:hypothetical protein